MSSSCYWSIVRIKDSDWSTLLVQVRVLQHSLHGVHVILNVGNKLHNPGEVDGYQKAEKNLSFYLTPRLAVDGDKPRICWQAVGKLLESCWKAVGKLLESCWQAVGKLLENVKVKVDF